MLRPRTIRINSAFDLGQPLLMLVNHRNHCDYATDDDGRDRHQQTAESENPIEQIVQAPPPQQSFAGYGGADRDRTGGLLVANQALSQLSYSPLTQLPVPSCQLPVKTTGTGH
jgi:hypothetical protein